MSGQRVEMLRSRLLEAGAYAAALARRAASALAAMRRDGPTPRQLRMLRTLGLVGVAAVVLCVPMALVIAGIASDPAGLAALVDQNPALAPALYALVNTLALFAAVIPGKPLEIVAGYLFGTWGGLAVVLAGIAVGEVVVFLAVRRWGMRLVEVFVPREKVEGVALFRDSRRLGIVAFLMMLIPGTPKDVVTYIAGITPMSLRSWLLLSLPARSLSILSSTVVGDQAARGNWGAAVAIEAAMLAVSVLGVAYYLLITKQARTGAIIDRVGRQEWLDAGSPLNDAGGRTA